MEGIEDLLQNDSAGRSRLKELGGLLAGRLVAWLAAWLAGRMAGPRCQCDPPPRAKPIDAAALRATWPATRCKR